jgi:hypothetical protein
VKHFLHQIHRSTSFHKLTHKTSNPLISNEDLCERKKRERQKKKEERERVRETERRTKIEEIGM